MRHNKEFVLPILSKIVYLESKEDYLKNFGELKNSDPWNKGKTKLFRDWIKKSWLSAYPVNFEFFYQCHQTLYHNFASAQP